MAERRGSSFEARDRGSGHTSDQAGQESEAAAGAVLASLPEPSVPDSFLLTPASRTGAPGWHQEARPAQGRPSRQVRSLHSQGQTPEHQSPGALNNQPEALSRRALWEL